MLYCFCLMLYSYHSSAVAKPSVTMCHRCHCRRHYIRCSGTAEHKLDQNEYAVSRVAVRSGNQKYENFAHNNIHFCDYSLILSQCLKQYRHRCGPLAI
jgi:hypothetical protein